MIDAVGMPIVVMLLSAAAVFGLIMEPSSRGPVAAVFPPWWPAAHAFGAAASAGRVIGFGGYPFVVIALPRHRQDLLQAGAWFLLDAEAFKACG
ncbi:hypothetical protein AruPA_12645 [Acidiphilium sp. PA]|uniref:hypothetical protein n=1 Tax=Acidiphilium sp. PA TaxID=2871705 RepID=UPI00224499D1|nr:hypothetical protein [Acidiphilium sp. PA]MCW8307890.1 hypothetical protein [Acidiphilium sp. PA]